MGGGNITAFAGNASILASRVTAPLSANAGNMRASEKLYRKGAFFAEIIACARRYAGRRYVPITGACTFNTRGKGIKITPKSAGARQSSVDGCRAPLFLCLFFHFSRYVTI